MKLNEHACRTFPEHIAVIRALAEKDETFRSMLADYEELCTWLAIHHRARPPDHDEFSQAREMIRNLEDEILARISKGGHE